MNLKSACRGIAILAIALLAGTTAIAQQRVLTPETILTIRTAADAQVSPDGTRIALQISRPRTADEKPGGPISEIWMMRAAEGEPWRFTHGESGEGSPRWSPDGSRLAFLSRRSGTLQVHVINVDGGEARQLTRSETNVVAFKWSPDGGRIAYTGADPKTKDETEAEKAGRDWTVSDQNYKHIRLHSIDVNSGASHVVTKSDVTVHFFDWSPDGAQLVIGAAPTPLIDDQFMKVRPMVVSASGGEPRLLAATEGKLTGPCWSPDGRWIAWLGATSLNDPYAGSIFIVPVAGGEPVNLLAGYEGTANWLGWKPGEGSTLLFTAIERQANALYSMSVADRRRMPLLSQPIIYGSNPSFTRDGSTLAMVANTPTHPNEVFLGRSGGTLNRLTRLNPQLDGLALGEQQIVKWKSVDGWEIEGILVKPVGYREGTRYPTIMQPHGGPEAADQNGWYGAYSRWGQMLAGLGYATFYPNYRGSIGRGVDFAKGDHRDLMGKEFQDMLAGLDHLIQQGIADPNRIGVGGGSYGGYTSAWAATYGSDRFRAAIAWMGISNWFSMTGTSDIHWENSLVHWDGIMYENFDLYWERSPIAHIARANTPTLIIHGAVDPRVPIGQSQELYMAMKWKGVPTEFVTYPRAGHGVTERAHQLDFMERVIGWFDKYVKNAPESK